jgi:hypothetical protein
LDVPSRESEEPGISRGLEWELREGARSLREDPNPDEGNDMVDDFPSMAAGSEWLRDLASHGCSKKARGQMQKGKKSN